MTATYKVITVIGARPQFVKAATVSRAFKKYPQVQEILVHTGQHYDANMSDIFFQEMEIDTPKYHLGVSGKGHAAMTGEMIAEIEKICLNEKPNLLMVYGDTNSTLAGALAAAKLHIPVAHVEAGLRSFNMRMPEEINRILTDRISDYLFCPTTTAIENLNNEGYTQFKNQPPYQIIKTGDVMLDAALFYSQRSKDKAQMYSKLNLQNFCLCTIHRAENTDSRERLESIFSALREISKKTTVVLPLHPRTKKFIQDYKIDTGTIQIIDPVGYFDMLEFLKNAQFILTDSGGLQKEAYFFDKPCITLRDETEWVELVQAGHNQVVGTNTENILQAVSKLKSRPQNWPKGIYGDGKASEQIAEFISELAK